MANDFQNQVSSRGSSGGNNVNGSGTSEISDILKGIGFDFNTYIKDQRDSLAKMAGMQQKFLEVMSKNEEIANLKNIQKKLEAENLSNEQRIELETKRQQILDRMVMESYNTVHQYRENLDNRYNKSRSMKERATLARQSSIELEVHKVAIRKKYNEELKAAAGNSVKQKEILEKQADELRTINEEQAIADDQSKKYNRINKALKFTGMQSSDEREQERKEQQARRSSRLNEINEELEEIALSYDSLTDEEKRNAEQRESQLKEERTHLEALSEKETELSKKREENFVKLENSVNQAYEKMFTLLTENVGKVNARLQGSGLTWESTTDLITTNLSINPFVKTENVINKLVEATNLGIAYNLEQRAFLATISEKIASTFNAFDSNLLRLIKLQQADSTAARLGIESSLTKFLNSMYEDTSYLSDLSSSVAGAIIDANAQLGRNASAEFEYTVQKWLGSLSSLGMSSNTVTNIAQVMLLV